MLAPGEKRSCEHFTVPVRFTKVESKEIVVGRTRGPYPSVEFEYRFQGMQYRSDRLFCVERGEVTLHWNEIRGFLSAAERGDPIVAWVKASEPQSACISLTETFRYATVTNTSSVCRAT
jgi:hypothetical protein